jgi:hypothetical protein
MKYFPVLLTAFALTVACQSGKPPKSQTKKGCNTCPSLSNEGKIDKPFKKKK